MARVRQHPDFGDAAAVAASVAQWDRHMGILEAQRQQGGPFVLGEVFTLADIVLGLSVQRWFASPIERSELPAVAADHRRLGGRAGFRAHGDNGMP